MEGKQNKKQTITEILLKANYISEEDLKRAEDFSKKNKVSLKDYLLSANLITKDLLGQAIAESLGVSYFDLNSHHINKEDVLKIPEAIAKKRRVIFVSEDKNSVNVASDIPQQANLAASLRRVFKGKKINIGYSLSEDIENNFVHYRQSLDAQFIKILQKNSRVAPEIIDEIFEDALINRASDIHFEPQDKEVIVRFRVDGIMHEAGRIPKEYYQNILNLIKVQSKLRIDEHFSTQDGAIRYKKDDKTIDMRVSITPTLDGEKAVIRVLAHYVRNFTLTDIGLSADHQNKFLEAGKKPFGMIIVAGPTGSGKTTTLYSLLKILNKPEVNITTIEDPVEYKLQGANQIQVNPQTNLTFAKGLRSIVRQDPDIILVGEIRDEETAEIAVNAALTGHLLLSTFHANDAATVIPRLLDMDVEPFLLSSTLEIVIAQRLVRKICEVCRISYEEIRSETKKTFLEADQYLPKGGMTLYKGKGCANCNHSGYSGRTAIFEMVYATKEMKDLILTNPSSQQIWELARQQGSKSLFEDGVEKVKSGLTTLEELFRVASPPTKSNINVKGTTKK